MDSQAMRLFSSGMGTTWPPAREVPGFCFRLKESNRPPGTSSTTYKLPFPSNAIPSGERNPRTSSRLLPRISNTGVVLSITACLDPLGLIR